jgi:hypothetical protein
MKCQTKPVLYEEKSIILNDTIIPQKEQVSEVDCLIGKWFIPHVAFINITFYEDSTFVFNDFNRETEEEEVLRGTFELNGNKLILKYNDRPQQTFKFSKKYEEDDNYYITKGKNYYFVKSSL